MAEDVKLIPIKKNFNTLMSESLRNLEQTKINHLGPGGVANLILGKVNRMAADFYESLDIAYMQSAVSQAREENLDLLGELLNCTRRNNESDDNYRYRITRQPLSLEKANETSVRLAALSIPEVVDVVMRPYTHGTGSFSIYVITNEALPSEDVLQRVRQQVLETASFGVKPVILAPRLAEVELKMKVLFDDELPDVDQNLIRSEATLAIRDYINSLLPGARLDMNHVTSTIRSYSDHILEVDVYYFTINGKSVYAVTQNSEWNQRFIEADINNAITII